MTRERANWVWRQDHESGIVDAILSYQLFDQQVTEICFSLRIELEKQVKKKKKNVLSMIQGNTLDMKGGKM